MSIATIKIRQLEKGGVSIYIRSPKIAKILAEIPRGPVGGYCGFPAAMVPVRPSVVWPDSFASNVAYENGEANRSLLYLIGIEKGITVRVEQGRVVTEKEIKNILERFKKFFIQIQRIEELGVLYE